MIRTTFLIGKNRKGVSTPEKARREIEEANAERITDALKIMMDAGRFKGPVKRSGECKPVNS